MKYASYTTVYCGYTRYSRVSHSSQWYNYNLADGTTKQFDRLFASSCRLSVRPSVTLCIVTLRVGVKGQKLYHRVPSRQLPIHFSDTLAVGCISSHNTVTAKTRTAEISASGIAMGNVFVHVTMVISDAAFSMVWSCSYVLRLRSAFLATPTLLVLVWCHLTGTN